jgi:putative intracellular protease/amidase
MDATTCLLCGKPLSRIRFRNDGPFCCREHRAQHQLRQGMNRVLEASRTDAFDALRRQRPEAAPLLRPVWLAAEKREYPGGVPAAPRRASEGFHRVLAVVSTARLAPAGDVTARPGSAALARSGRRTAAAPALGRTAAVRPQAPAARRIARPAPPPADPAFRSATAVAAPVARRVEQPRRMHSKAAPVMRARGTEAAPSTRGAMPVAAFAADGGLVLGICNGFQVLAEAGLVPGTLLRNRSLRFAGRWISIATTRAATMAPQHTMKTAKV